MTRCLRKFIGLWIAAFLSSAVPAATCAGQSLSDLPTLRTNDDSSHATSVVPDQPIAPTANLIQSPLSRSAQTRSLFDGQRRLQPIPSSNTPSPYFASDEPAPVILVWLNSDLDDQLLTTDQLKNWIQLLPERDNATAPTSILGGVQQVSFLQQEKSNDQEQTTEDPPASEEQQLSDAQAELKKRKDNIGKRIEGREKQIVDDKSIDDSTRTELLSQLKAASEKYQKSSDDFEKLVKQSAAAESFDTSLEEQQEALLTEKNMPPESSSDGNVDELKVALRAIEEALQKAIDSQSAIRQKITEREKRIAELPSLQIQVNKELSDVRKKAESLKDSPEGLNRTLQALIIEARELSAEINKELLDIEEKRQDQLSKIQPIQRETLTLKIKRLGTEADSLRKAIDKKLQKQIDDQKLNDRDVLQKTLTQNTPVLKKLAEENIALTKATEELIRDNKKLTDDLANIREQNNQIDTSYDELKQYIETRGKTASGIRLIEHRRGLISTGASRSRLSELQTELQVSRTEIFKLKEIRDRISDNDQVLNNIESDPKIQELAETDSGPRYRDALDIAKRLVQSQTEYVDELIEEYKAHIEKILDLQVEHKKLVSNVQNIKAFSDENALWIRSAEPIGLKELSDCRKGILHFYKDYDWQSYASWGSLKQSIQDRFKTRPYDTACLVLFVGTLFVIQRRLRWTHA